MSQPTKPQSYFPLLSFFYLAFSSFVFSTSLPFSFRHRLSFSFIAASLPLSRCRASLPFSWPPVSSASAAARLCVVATRAAARWSTQRARVAGSSSGCDARECRSGWKTVSKLLFTASLPDLSCRQPDLACQRSDLADVASLSPAARHHPPLRRGRGAYSDSAHRWLRFTMQR